MKKTLLLLFVFPLFMHAQYDNGPLGTGTVSNSGVNAPAGDEWSEVQNETGNTTYSNTLAGVSCSVTSTVFRCADDFIVPAGETWTINQVVTFAYQTGYAGGTSPITAATLQIWDGVPGDPGSSVIFGDASTNRLASTNDTGLWRIFNSAVPAPGATPATNRKIWNVFMSVTPPIQLTEGTYWIDWNTQISANGAHFTPPVTVVGERSLPGMNARQFTATGWVDVMDVGNPDIDAPDVNQDFPFQLYGSFVQNCTAPENLSASNITEVSTEISWDASIDEITGYDWILMAENEDPLTDPPLQTGSVATGITTALIVSLDSNTTYDVYVMTNCDTNQSPVSDPVTFTTVDPLSNVNHTIKGFSLFPTPVENHVNIKADEEIKSVVVLNLLGQRLMQFSVNATNTQLDLTKLASGYYFLEVHTNDHTGVYRINKK